MSNPAWPFASYAKIPETPDAWGLDEAGFRALSRVPWAVTEKIHGANFCFITDGAAVQCANRRAILRPDEPFFAYQRVRTRLSDAVRSAFGLVQHEQPKLRRLLIYGELFGGGYPHPDVPAEPTVQPVQTGIWYAPSIEFCAFDLAIVGAEEGPPRYLDYEQALVICERAGLLAATPLSTGSLNAALAFPLGFDSTIPARLGLPALGEPNAAEGVVIKPVRELRVVGAKGPVRPLLKRKIPAFAEDRRYAEARPWPHRPAATESELEALLWTAYNLVTLNRLDAAISKLGRGRRGDGRHVQRVFRLLVDDVLEQLSETSPHALAGLTDDERARLLQVIGDEVRALLRANAVRKATLAFSAAVSVQRRKADRAVMLYPSEDESFNCEGE